MRGQAGKALDTEPDFDFRLWLAIVMASKHLINGWRITGQGHSAAKQRTPGRGSLAGRGARSLQAVMKGEKINCRV